jgi:hypothetical protein
MVTRQTAGGEDSESRRAPWHATDDRTAVGLFTTDGVLLEANQFAFEAVG